MVFDSLIGQLKKIASDKDSRAQTIQFKKTFERFIKWGYIFIISNILKYLLKKIWFT